MAPSGGGGSSDGAARTAADAGAITETVGHSETSGATVFGHRPTTTEFDGPSCASAGIGGINVDLSHSKTPTNRRQLAKFYRERKHVTRFVFDALAPPHEKLPETHPIVAFVKDLSQITLTKPKQEDGTLPSTAFSIFGRLLEDHFAGKEVPFVAVDNGETGLKLSERDLALDAVLLPRSWLDQNRALVDDKSRNVEKLRRVFEEAFALLDIKRMDEDLDAEENLGQAIQYCERLAEANLMRIANIVLFFNVKQAQVVIHEGRGHKRSGGWYQISDIYNVCEVERLVGNENESRFAVRGVFELGTQFLKALLERIKYRGIPYVEAGTLFPGRERFYPKDFAAMRLLGSGAAGSVIAARLPQDPVEYCLKTVTEVEALEHEIAFLRELQAYREDAGGGTRALDEVVSLHFPELAGSTSYRLLSKPVGDSCMALAQRPSAMRAFGGIIEALVWMHNTMGFVHCDVSPGNLIAVNGHLQLIDFGCASRIGEETNYGGSKWYASDVALQALVAAGDSWDSDVTPEPIYDLEGLVKTVAGITTPFVAQILMNRARHGGGSPRFVAEAWDSVWKSRWFTEAGTGYAELKRALGEASSEPLGLKRVFDEGVFRVLT